MSEAAYHWRGLPALTRPTAEVIGDPISQSKSPVIHSFWIDKLGLDAAYRAAHVPPAELADYLVARRADPLWRGCNVTMPHKQAVMALLDEMSGEAAKIGAVNTVVPREDGRLAGYNTDLPGSLEPLGDRLVPNAVVIGAGGATRAFLTGLNQRGVGHVWLKNRDVAKAQRLLDELGIKGEAVPLDADVPDAALLANTSSLGMTGYPLMPARILEAAGRVRLVYDIVTSPLETDLLRRARDGGAASIDGLSMLIGQAAVAFAHFFGVAPLRDDGDAELRRQLNP